MVTMVFQIISPCVVLASSDKQNKSTSGSPLAAENMVNMFNGSFSYSLPVIDIPGPNGSDYSMSLNYNSSISPDEDASWVGYGWSLAPGSITRQKRGIPDDLLETEVTQILKQPPVQTVAITYRAPLFETYDQRSMNGDLTLRYNTLKGWSLVPSIAAGFPVSGWCSLQSNLSEQGIGFSPSVNFANLFQLGSTVDKFDFTNIDSYTNLLNTGISSASLFSLRERDYSFGSPKTKGNTAINTIGIQTTQYLLTGPQNLTFITNFSSLEYNNEPYTKKANGYLFADAVKNGDDENAIDIMDYEVEKEKSFKTNGRFVDNIIQSVFSDGDNNTKYLPTPYSNADLFTVTGPINGTFRAFHNKKLNFRLSPNQNVSAIEHITEEPLIPEGGFPWQATGLSGGIGVGYTTFTSGKSGFEIGGQNNHLRSNYVANNPQFVFIGDKGGIIEGRTPLINNGRRITSSIPITPITHFDTQNEGKHNGSLVGTKTQTYSKVDQKYFNKEQNIVGFRFVDQQGKRCVYAQPIVSQNEYQVSFGVNDKVTQINGKIIYSDALHLEKDFFPLNTNTKNFSSLNVKIMKEPYATSYLLSEMTTHDYVDIDDNGCSVGDLGGYTVFEYREHKDLYKWRSPTRGFFYQQGSIYSKKDDKATVSYGQKNIVHLFAVKTKTHAAYFVTNKTYKALENGIVLQGSDNVRQDCNVVPSEKVAGINNVVNQSINPNEYLESIHLYELDNNGDPVKMLKKVNFAYDYSLQKNSPGCNPDKGKLTLKRVWVETEQITEKEIPQYVFGYTYPSTPSGIHTSYNSLFPTAAVEENPDYNVNNIDDWGYYQKDGTSRYKMQLIGTNQDPSDAFDPAAYVLKTIQLPGGGQIFIQYEQNTYRYVQNRECMVLAPINSFGEGNEDHQIVIDPKDIPGLKNLFSQGATQDQINLREKEVNDIIEKINSMFVHGGEQMYMKVLASLKGTFDSPPNLSYIDLQTETKDFQYIPVYASVVNCEKVNGKIVIEFSQEGDVPWEDVVENYIATHNIEESETEDVGDVLQSMINGVFNLTSLIPQSFLMDDCVSKLSYIKIPIGFDKKGGGIRVKKILTHNPDNSLEEGDAALYGTEYYYQIYDDNLEKFVSSGVATNEPMASREANSMVKLVGDDAATYKDEIITGENILQFEGPIGEELLPSPSIGYRQIIAKDINKGYSSGGYTIYRFNTVLEYPSVATEISTLQKSISGLPFDLSVGIASYSSVKTSAYQNYRFILNSMHGTQQSVHHFSSQFENIQEVKDGNKAPISSVEYSYFKTGESIPVMTDLDRPFRYLNLGQQGEYVTERRLLDETSYQGNLEATYGVFPVPPLVIAFPPMFSFAGSMQYSSAEVKTEVSTEILTNAVFVKSVKTMQDGIISESENIAFDKFTGSPLIVRVNDGYDGLNLGSGSSEEHDGSYYNYTIPAYFHYKEMGPASINEGAIISTRKIVGNGHRQIDPVFSYIKEISIVNHTTSRPALKISFKETTIPNIVANQREALKEFFSDGDLVEFYDKDLFKGIYYIGKPIFSGTNDLIFEEFYPSTKSQESNWDNPMSTQEGTIKIIKSGRTNRLAENSSTFTLYGCEKEINDALNYAQQLRDRQRVADVLNNWVNYGQGNQSPKWDQMFVYQLQNMDILDPIYMDVKSPDFNMDMAMLFNVRDNHIRYHLTPIYSEYNSNSDMDHVRIELKDYEWRYHKTSNPFPIRQPGNYYGRPDNNPCNLYESDYRSVYHLFNGDVLADLLRDNYFNQGRFHTPKTFEYYTSLNSLSDPKCNKGEKILQDIEFSRGDIFGIDDNGELGLYTNPEKATLSGQLRWIPRGSTRRLINNSIIEETNPDFNTSSPNYNNRFKRRLLETFGNYCAFPMQLQNPGTQKILKASAIQYKNNWNYDYTDDNSTDKSLPDYTIPYVHGQKIFRPCSTYIYRSSIVSTGSIGTSAAIRVYSGAGQLRTTVPPPVIHSLNLGLRSGSSLLNSSTSTSGSGWILVNAIEEYSPDGVPIVVKDALGVYSSSRLSHRGTLIACKGSNVKNIFSVDANNVINTPDYEVEMYYQSFEPTGLSINNITQSSNAHTGKYACSIIQNLNIPTGIRHLNGFKDYSIKFWAKDFDSGDKVKIGSQEIVIKSIGKVPYTFTPTGLNDGITSPWELWEGEVSLNVQNSPFEVNIENNQPIQGQNRTIVIDDFVMCPKNSTISCCVYGDNNFRKIAEFNDNHFAKLIQYDMKGQPVREIIETPYGFKTVNESTNNIYRVERDALLINGSSSAMGSQPQPSIRMRKERTFNKYKLNGLWSPNGERNNVDIMNFNVSPGDSHIDLFGSPKNLDSIYLKKNNILPLPKSTHENKGNINLPLRNISDSLKNKINNIRIDSVRNKKKYYRSEKK